MLQPLLQDILILLAIAALAVALCRQLGLSPVLGFLATGIVSGPHALGLLPDSTATRFLAELGMVLLLFTIGLEFSVSRLLAMRRLVFGLGGAQVVLTALVLGGILWLWLDTVSVAGAFALGIALALSSTAIVLKQLAEQLELAAPHGRLILAVLLFQDLAAVGVLAALPALTGAGGAALGHLTGRVLVAAATLAAMVLLGRRLLPSILHWIAATRSLELFMLTTLLLALAAGLVSELVGLSPALGAFMAGMLLGETPFRHQIEADIRPFRDLMLGLFFATIGMQLDLGLLAGGLPWLLPALLGLILVKAALVAGLAGLLFRQSSATAWRSALCLAQGGELGLLLLTSALERELISAALGQPLLALIILSMAVAPLLLRSNGPIAARLTSLGKAGPETDLEAQLASEGTALSGHVLICGYGDRGQNLAAILAREGIPSLALDLDPERVRQARSAGARVAYGDCTRPGVLRAAGLERAAALAVTYRDGERLARTLAQLQRQGDLPPVLIRKTGADRDADLRAIGAEVFPEHLESSLQFAQQLLLLLGLPQSRVETAVAQVRSEHYASLRAVFLDSNEVVATPGGRLENATVGEPQLSSVTLHRNSPAVGQTPEQLGLEADGIELLDVRRAGIRVPGPLLDTELRGGDVLVLRGPGRALEQAMARLLDGA
ncbi:MAG: cation:proton antiporter [Halochromatium sp.]